MKKQRNLYIIGASGLGQEMESWLNLTPVEEREWIIKGYIDIDKNSLDKYPSEFRVLGEETTFKFSDTDSVLISIADPIIKEKIYNLMKKKDVHIMTYIAPNMTIGKFCELGKDR